jgi:hypothetical protein
MTTLGTDFRGIEDIDAAWSEESDETKAMQQSLARRYICPPGGLFYDQGYGYDVRDMAADVVDTSFSQRAIDAEGKKDERVQSMQSSVTQGDDGKTLIGISGTGVTGQPFALTLQVSDVSVTLLNGGT